MTYQITFQSFVFGMTTTTTTTTKYYKNIRIINDERILDFSTKLGNTLWDVSNSDINICYSKFHSTFKSFYDECFPVSVIRKKIKHGKSKLWFTAGLEKSVHKNYIVNG